MTITKIALKGYFVRNYAVSMVSGFSWCGICDVFQTSAIDAQDDMKLKYLVEQFQLYSGLLS